MTRIPSAIPMVAISMLSACGLLTPPHEDLRWKKLESTTSVTSLPPELLGPGVSVYAVANPPKDGPASPSLKDLSDRGQQALVQALVAKGATPEEIRKAVFGGSDGKPSSPIEGGKFSRTLVATITKGVDTMPGDRLMWVWVIIKPHNFRFSGYSIVATDVASLNIAHLQDQTTTTLSATGSLAFPAPGPNLSTTDSIANQKVASTDIAQQYTKTSVDILPTELRIYRESERNLDVAGNNVINLTLDAVGDDMHPNLRVTSMEIGTPGKWATDDKIAFTVVRAAPTACPLTADVSLIYQKRKITDDSRQSYDESKQTVVIERGMAASKRVELVSAPEVHPLTFKIYAASRNTPLQATDVLDRRQDLEFTSMDQARTFAAFLNAKHMTFEQPGFTLGKTGVKVLPDQGVGAVTGPFHARGDQRALSCPG